MFQWDIALCRLRAIAKAPKAQKLPEIADSAKAAKAVGLFLSKSLKTLVCQNFSFRLTSVPEPKVSCPHRLALAGVAVGTMHHARLLSAQLHSLVQACCQLVNLSFNARFAGSQTNSQHLLPHL